MLHYEDFILFLQYAVVIFFSCILHFGCEIQTFWDTSLLIKDE